MSEKQQTGPSRNPAPTRPAQRRRSVSHRLLVRLLVDQLNQHRGSGLEVVDLGGGTGGLAAALAEAGHRVLVVDPSPDALAATSRRAAESGLGDRMRAVQGDTTTLAEVVPAGSADVVLCHLVLERRAGTAEALRAIAGAVAPEGLLSVLIGQRLPRVLQQAEAGNFAAAGHLLSDPELLDRTALHELLTEAGWDLLAEHGIGVIADQVTTTVAEGRSEELLELETAASARPELLEAAPKLHVLSALARSAR
ncbi:methyltransferase domain-containing protein [Naumannella sp. ID2617S]|nr:methyltransferase domain-containing protein [Naumannella sp. ID2617S]